eukprot:gene1379-48969_t
MELASVPWGFGGEELVSEWVVAPVFRAPSAADVEPQFDMVWEAEEGGEGEGEPAVGDQSAQPRGRWRRVARTVHAPPPLPDAPDTAPGTAQCS